MRIARIQLVNFRSHTELDLDLSGVQAAAIVGRNGAGKSSLFDAIDFCLYGGPADALLRHTAKTGGVTLELETEGQRWRINRGRERGKKSWLVVEQATSTGWAPVPFNHIADAQAFLEGSVLAMGADAWRASVYAAQGEAGVLAAMRPGERKALLGGLLGLERYEEWRERAAADARGLTEKVAAFDDQVARERERADGCEAAIDAGAQAKVELTVAATELQDLTNELADAMQRQADVERVERRKALVAQMRSIKERGKEVERQNAEREKLAEEIKTLAGAQEEYDSRDAARQQLNENLAAARREHDKRLAQVRDAEAVVDRAAASIATDKRRWEEAKQTLEREQSAGDPPPLPEDKCPTCGQAVHGEAQELAMAAVEQRKAEREARVKAAQEALVLAQEALREGTERLREDRSRCEALRDEVAAIPEPSIEFDQEGFNAAREKAMKLVSLQGQAAQLGAKQDVEVLRSEWAQVKAEAEKLPEVVPDGPLPSEVQERTARVEAVVRDLQRRVDDGERAEVARAEHLRVAAELEAEARELVDRSNALHTLANACSRNGIPAMILDNATGGIEQAANEALESLGSSMKLRIVTQVAKASGKGSKETLEILVDDGMQERPLESFSGGERYRVHVALRMGLAEMLSAGSGRSCDVLLIDEPTDLDKEGVQLLSELLARVPHQVLLVTHLDELVHALPQRILVERPSDTQPSTVTVM